MSGSTGAIAQISQLLPLDEESLQQILDYSSTLSKEAAATHLKGILGDSPRAIEFISSFNSRQDASAAPVSSQPPPSQPTSSDAPRKGRKKKAPLHKLPPPRRPENHGDTSGAYSKKKEEDYISGPRHRQESPKPSALALSDKPAARQLPTPAPTLKPPPSASGPLISDLPNVRTTSRASSPAVKAKINLSGGSAMHGASTTLQDLDSAIRTLELQTNPSLSASPAERRCNCLATRHPLLAAAPNCLECGKIICVKEGLGPCTFCSSPLLSSEEINAMIRSLREERGAEKMSLNNASQRRADVAQAPRPFSTPAARTDPLPSSSGASAAETTLSLARQHRDRLLAYQRDNARRTHIIDEAADFEVPAAGQSMWSTPAQRAAQLKRQQQVLREQEWAAKPEFEKRRVVLSLDLVGGKAVRRMGEVRLKDKEEGGDDKGEGTEGVKENGKGGAFSNNPLLGPLIRPVWKNKEKTAGTKKGNGNAHANGKTAPDDEPDAGPRSSRTSAWRRVQDEDEDNEPWILDGGVYGGGATGGVGSGE